MPREWVLKGWVQGHASKGGKPPLTFMLGCVTSLSPLKLSFKLPLRHPLVSFQCRTQQNTGIVKMNNNPPNLQSGKRDINAQCTDMKLNSLSDPIHSSGLELKEMEMLPMVGEELEHVKTM